ncbi:MAG TPA: chemotaxis-specific protein-glutamate methyltransferase CheB [Edaphobacter sp.]|nr:chemotaxis-specific protein-glutamate methyltransferase CheB [Edaphobacter sp.]
MGIVAAQPLRVLAADDSAVMRGILRILFERQSGYTRGDLPRMELVGVSRDGVECLQEIHRLAPDVLILDLEMPRMNGLDVLDRLRHTKPKLPVIMCSSHTERGARATFDALARGAADYVMKPAGQRDLESSLSSLAEQLLPRIAAFGVERRQPASEIGHAPPVRDRSLPGMQHRRASPSNGTIEVLVIGVSTGGPTALEQLLPRLSPELPVPALIVQHMPKLFTNVLAERLSRCCSLSVSEAQAGAPLKRGAVWLAPGDMHMEIAVRSDIAGSSSTTQVRLHSQEPLHHCRPAVDYLFFSAARIYGAGVLAVVLTGMGSDGLDGARAVHARGGVVLAQDEASSAVWGMPGRVAEAGIAAAVLPLDALAREINHRVKAGRPANAATPSGSLIVTREVSDGLH